MVMTNSEIDVKKTIEQLIKSGTTFNLNQLELLYHKNIEVIMLDDKGNKMLTDKTGFKNIFKQKKDNGDPPLNTWAEFHHISTHENNGHVILTRKVNLTGEEKKLTLSIDLIFEDNRWQVTREVIFSQPITD